MALAAVSSLPPGRDNVRRRVEMMYGNQSGESPLRRPARTAEFLARYGGGSCDLATPVIWKWISFWANEVSI